MIQQKDCKEQKKIYLEHYPGNTDLPTVTLSGTVSIPAPNRHFQRTPKEWILYIVTEGSMTLQEDDHVYRLSAGDAIVLSPGRCHIGIETNHFIKYDYIHFQWKNLQESSLGEEAYASNMKKALKETTSLLSDEKNLQTLLFPKKITLLPACFSEVITLSENIRKEAETLFPFQSYMKNCMLAMIFLTISRSAGQEIVSEISGHSFIPELVSYLRHHADQKITGSILEKDLHRNFDHMNRIFKKNTGKSIFQYLQEYRIKESKKMLQTGYLNISEIAEKLGYCNAFYFSRVFKSYEHLTPSDYRKKYQK